MKIKDEHRTLSVIQLATQLHEYRDYSLLPILADALDEAGADGSELRVELDAIQASRLVCLVMGGETEAAVEYLDVYAKMHDRKFDELIANLDGYEKYGCMPTTDWDGEDVPEELFASYEIVTGKPFTKRTDYFRCAC